MSGALLIEGGCHCKALTYALDWPLESDGDIANVPARRCSCSYCTRIDGAWTSHPQAKLTISEDDNSKATRYRFATGTADFLFCSNCGITPVVVCEIEGQEFAVVNVNTFADGFEGYALDHASTDFEGESVGDRLERRKARWIGEVRWRTGNSDAARG